MFMSKLNLKIASKDLYKKYHLKETHEKDLMPSPAAYDLKSITISGMLE